MAVRPTSHPSAPGVLVHWQFSEHPNAIWEIYQDPEEWPPREVFVRIRLVYGAPPEHPQAEPADRRRLRRTVSPSSLRVVNPLVVIATAARRPEEW